jgi:hypothetical protein
MPVKKSKRKLQHKRAIAAYKKWEKKHPHAPIERKVQEFNILVDSSALEEALDAVQTTAA